MCHQQVKPPSVASPRKVQFAIDRLTATRVPSQVAESVPGVIAGGSCERDLERELDCERKARDKACQRCRGEGSGQTDEWRDGVADSEDVEG